VSIFEDENKRNSSHERNDGNMNDRVLRAKSAGPEPPTPEPKRYSNEGEFKKLKDYILESAIKLPDGTPIFSGRHFAGMLDEARKEFPKEIFNDLDNCIQSHPTKYKLSDWFLKFFGKEE
jgi:hypothetical protein